METETIASIDKSESFPTSASDTELLSHALLDILDYLWLVGQLIELGPLD